MSCNCQPCALVEAAVVAAVLDLFSARLRQAFHNRRLPCSTDSGSHWYTGTWDGSRWSGHNHVLHGDYTILSCDGSSISATIVFHIEDTGTWEDNH